MPETRRTNAGFLSNKEAAREKQRIQAMVRNIAGTKQTEETSKANYFIINPKFWSSNRGRIVTAIVINRAYDRQAILKATMIDEKDFDSALGELFKAELLEEKRDGKLWVTRELYWQCQSFFQQAKQAKEEDVLTSSENIEKVKTAEDHITKEEFLLEFFGAFSRDLGNPQRWFTTNPTDLFPFIEECAENRVPAFINVQPMKRKAQPLGIEKVFFDFDYCKNNEILPDAETQKRKAELREEVKHFLKKLNDLNIKPLVVQTRRGYHVHIFFDSVYEIDEDVVFSKQTYRQLQLDLLNECNYRFIDFAVVGDINRMCRIPLSIHEKSSEECIIVNGQLNEDKVRSIEYFKLYGLKRKDIESARKKAKELEKTNKERRTKYVDRNLVFESSDGIRPCFVKALNSGEMCHQQRLALLSEAYSLGFHSPESIIELFRCLNDFDYSITSYQVNWFFTHWVEKSSIRPYNCRTVQRYGWCLNEDYPRYKKTN